MIISSNIVSSFVHPTVKGLRVYHCCYVNDVVNIWNDFRQRRSYFSLTEQGKINGPFCQAKMKGPSTCPQKYCVVRFS
jgi:hypothetical protein